MCLFVDGLCLFIGDYSGTKPGFAEAFECHICRQLHSTSHKSRNETKDHLRCPKPAQFSQEESGSLLTEKEGDWFAQEYIYRQYQFEAFKEYYDQGISNWTYMDLYNRARQKIEKVNPYFIKSGLIDFFFGSAQSNYF